MLLVGERGKGARQLLLDEAAHGENAAADHLHLGVELLVRMLGHGHGSVESFVSRIFR